MKKLKVPYLETLDVLDLSSVGFLMEKAQRESIDVINWEEYSYKPIVAFDIARSKVNLYIRYFVKGNSLKALYETDGSPVYQDSCVEFFMKRVNDPNYYNFEFNCIGTCDASYRESRDSKKSLTPEEMGLDPDNLPEKIMGNFYKCADDTEFPHFVSWSPIDLPSPNFHCPEFFGEIYL